MGNKIKIKRKPISMLCGEEHYAALHRIFTHDSVFYSAKDDGVSEPWKIAQAVLSDKRMIVLMPNKDTVFLFVPVNYITHEVHVGIIAGKNRNKGVKSAIKVCRWMFKNTPCRKLISYIPSFHEASVMFSQVCGMEKEGLLKKSYLYNGGLFDLHVMGGTRERFIELHGEIK